MKRTLFLAPFVAVGLAWGCSGSGDASPSTSTAKSEADAGPVDEVADAAAPDLCAPPPSKSRCKNEGSWVRGIARFDPSHFEPGAKPVLRVVLRHRFAVLHGEDAIGGRLHGWASVPIDDLTTGEVPFAIDMCALGTAMWSEENDDFHLVLILDEDDNNDLDDATTNEEAIAIGTPGPNELAKVVDVDVSCHAPPACLDVSVDCKGPSCTKIDPITSCKKRTPGCESDVGFCR